MEEAKLKHRAVNAAPQALACLVCGVDSGPVLKFFVWMIGAGVLASICILIWAINAGKFSNHDSLAQTPLKAELDSQKGVE